MNTELFGRATDYVQGVLSAVTREDLRQPTPCEGWDTGRVVLQLVDVSDGLIGLLETGTLAMPQPPRTSDPDPVALLNERLAKLTGALSDSGAGTRVDSAVRAGAVELTTHGWDIGLAGDPAHQIPESLAEDVLALVAPGLDASARGANFAAPIEVPSDASASERLVAFLGRAPKR